MKTFLGDSEKPTVKQPTHLTIGGFDGIHLGHKELINKMSRAKTKKETTMIVTFHPSPIQYFSNLPNTLTDIQEKEFIFKSLNIDHLWVLPFNEKIQKMNSDDFFNSYLLPNIHVKAYHCGNDHGLGRNRSNSSDDLERRLTSRGIGFHQYDLERRGAAKISSSRIRELIRGGRVEEANKLLGHYFLYNGKIEEGDKIGGRLGFPTANLECKKDKIIPAEGVYWGAAKYREEIFRALIYVGRRPSIKKTDLHIKVEAFLFDFDKNIYGEQLTVYFIKQLRKDRYFKDKEALRHQIEKDANQSRKESINLSYCV